MVSVKATVGGIEEAFAIRLVQALRADGTRFYEPDREPSIPLSVRVAHVYGLDNYRLPKAMNAVGYYGPGGTVGATDLRHAYLHGLSFDGGLTGSGQTVCIAGDECILPSDIQSYADFYHLPFSAATQLKFAAPAAQCPAPDGGPPDGGWNLPGDEKTMDVEMAIAMAPGATIYVGASIPGTTFLQNAADNGCKQISTSFSLVEPADLFNELALQGQSLFSASGDEGAWSPTNDPPNYIGVEAITYVGGTDLFMGDAGRIDAEIPWNSSGGGHISGLPLPWYQAPAAYAAVEAGASTSLKNGPDVSANASNVDQWRTTLVDGVPVAHHESFPGTSASSPLWGGFMALVNQQIALTDYSPNPAIGFANPALYALAASPDAGSLFTDITHDLTPSDGNLTGGCSGVSPPDCLEYHAAKGFDLETGLGSPLVGLIAALAAVKIDPTYVQNQGLHLGSYGPPNPYVTNVAGGAATSGNLAYVVGNDGGVYSFNGTVDTWGGTGNSSDPGFTAITPGPDGGATNAVQVTSAPTGTPWYVRKSDGHLFEWNGSHWIVMNTASSGNQNHLSWAAVGPPGAGVGAAVWGVSQTSGGGTGNFVIYNGDGGTTWTNITAATGGIGGVQIAVSPTTGTPWVLNAQGEVYYGTYSSGSWSWTQLQFPTADAGVLDGGTVFDSDGGILATSITVGPPFVADASGGGVAAGTADGVWVTTTHPWVPGGAPVETILEVVQYYSPSDTTWSVVSGGGVQLGIGDNGITWVLSSGGRLFRVEGYPRQ